MHTQEIPLSELISSSLNPRSNVESTFRDQLKTSILNSGLMTPLTVRKNGKGYIVLDGNTRLSVLEELEQDCLVNGAPCVVLDEDETVDDVEYALLVNQLRRPIDPWDESAAYHSMVITDGKSFKDTAKAFGVTEKHVRQRIALAELPPQARECWKAGTIDTEALTYMTTLDDDVIERFFEDRSEHQDFIRGWDVRAYARKFVYSPDDAIFTEKLDSVLSQDLFDDVQYVADSDAFRKLQLEAISDLQTQWSEWFPNAEVEHIKTSEDLWSVHDAFQKQYKIMTALNIDSSYDWSEPSSILTSEPDVVQIFSDDRMRIKLLAGKHMSDEVTPHTDTTVRTYSGLLLDTCRSYWRLTFCEYLAEADLKTSVAYIQEMHWRTAIPSNFMDFKNYGSDRALEKRVDRLNKLFGSKMKCRNSEQAVAAFAAKCASSCNWGVFYRYIKDDKKFHQHRAKVRATPASLYLFTKMKKPLLISVLDELEPDDEHAHMSKIELVTAACKAAEAHDWLPPLDLLS